VFGPVGWFLECFYFEANGALKPGGNTTNGRDTPGGN
jgi:hypothetical protein